MNGSLCPLLPLPIEGLTVCAWLCGPTKVGGMTGCPDFWLKAKVTGVWPPAWFPPLLIIHSNCSSGFGDPGAK